METQEKRPRGRPRKKIEVDIFKKLCTMQCTLQEIAGFFDCSEDTIENWCKKKFKCLFSEIYKTASAEGKISLRRTQFKMADKSPAMAIFLGKQYLGQRDQVEENDSHPENITFVFNRGGDKN